MSMAAATVPPAIRLHSAGSPAKRPPFASKALTNGPAIRAAAAVPASLQRKE